MRIPDVLMSGHHAEIAKWRRRQSEALTQLRRPDLLTDQDKETAPPEK
jgi:tRNA (guanine37-N1)-methyltransferase